jgi:hypothetical protein
MVEYIHLMKMCNKQYSVCFMVGLVIYCMMLLSVVCNIRRKGNWHYNIKRFISFNFSHAATVAAIMLQLWHGLQFSYCLQQCHEKIACRLQFSMLDCHACNPGVLFLLVSPMWTEFRKTCHAPIWITRNNPVPTYEISWTPCHDVNPKACITQGSR